MGVGEYEVLRRKSAYRGKERDRDQKRGAAHIGLGVQ
jgi:hypothetical protein